MSSPDDWPRIAPAAFDDTHRLIPGEYTEDAEHALADLAGSDQELLALVQLAAATNARLQAQAEHHPGGLDRGDVVFDVPYSKIVNAAFAYPGQGARFHRPDGRGAWYCALDLDTCLAEVVYHRVRHLAETGLTDEDDIAYRLFRADVHGQDFAWLDDDNPATRECLDPDSYAAGQELGSRMLTRAAAGIIYPSVRRPAGTNIAVLVPAIVANVRREALYQLTIQGGTLTTVNRVG